MSMEHHNNPGQSPQGKPAPSQAEREAFGAAGLHQQETRTTESRTVTAASIGSAFRRGLRSSPGNAVVREFEKTAKELVKDILGEPSGGVKYGVSSLDDSFSPDIPAGSILLTADLIAGDTKKRVVLVYTLIVVASASSNLYLPEKDRNGRSFNMAVPVNAFIKGAYKTQIVEKLAQQYNEPIEVIFVGSADLPRILSPRLDSDDAERLFEMCRIGFGALDTELDRTFFGNAERLTVEIIKRRATTQVVTELEDRPQIGPNGLPIRKDLSLTLRANVHSEIEGMADKVTDVVQVGAMVNLLYVQPPRNMDRNMREDTRRYVPQILLTSLTPSRDINIITLETQVLALAIVGTFAIDDQWKAAFLPMATAKNPFRNFAATGIDVNYGPEGSAHTAAPEKEWYDLSLPEQLQMLNMALFSDRLQVALLVDDSDPYSFINGIFKTASEQSERGYHAYEKFVDAADALTQGKFSPLWFPNGDRTIRPPLARDTGLVLHQGYYEDTSKEGPGGLRSIMDVDYLYMGNRYGVRSIDTVYRYADTILNESIDANVRLQDRWEIISNTLHNPVLTGMGAVIEINPDLIKAVTAAVAQAGLNLRPSNSLVDTSGSRGRSVYSGGMGRGLDTRGITEALSSGYGSSEQDNRSYYGGGGFNNRSW